MTTIEQLAARVRGPVLAPDDQAYDGERLGFQAGRLGRPDVIIGATSAEDVAAAVAYATEHDLPVGVRGTGHGQTIRSEDGGVLVTTARLDDLTIDPSTRTARFGAGVRWERVVEAAAAHGLAPLSGSAPGVGAVSYTLGGGIGLLARAYGFAADRVRRIEIVDANARIRTVTGESDPDHFRALRGGRENFGIATALTVELVPVTRLYGGGVFLDAAAVSGVPQAYLEWTRDQPDAMTSAVGLIPMPDADGVPEPLRGRHVVHLRFAYDGDPAEGERLVAPLRGLGPELLGGVGEIPYTQGGSIFSEPTFPHGFYGDNALVDGSFGAEGVGELLALVGPGTPAPTVVELRHLGGALSGPPACGVPNSVGWREAAYVARWISVPSDPKDLDGVRKLHGRVFDALRPWTLGQGLTFMFGDATEAQVRQAYEPETYAWLTAQKARHDPADRFRLGHHIPLPGGATRE